MFEFCEKKDLVFVDIEANDKPKRILQFGAVKLKKNNDIECRNWFSNPKCKISPHILKMVHKNLLNIENGISSIRIIEKIYRFLNNTVLVTYGPFDYTFLDSMSLKFLKKKLNVIHIDLQDEWKKMSMSKNVWALNKLGNFFNIDINENKLHDAFYDADILYKIFREWKSQNENKECLVKNIYKHVTQFEKKIKITQNLENKNAKTMNNTLECKGLCFLNINFKESKWFESPKKLLSDFDVLEVVGHEIKRNWNFHFDINSKDFDNDIYEDVLSSNLKKLVTSIKNKKIIINESQYQKLIRIANLCAKYIDVFPINNISFTTGYNNLFEKIDVNFEKFMSNQDLIKNWKVYEYLINQEKE